jgi:hypothetical protein
MAPVKRLRQNHALEHATMHVLAQHGVAVRLIGRSDWSGFVLYGEVDTQLVLRAVSEALSRLQRGEGELAIHPRCGTNLAVAALLGGGAALALIALPTRARWGRVLGGMAAMLAVLALAQPLGLRAQRVCTTTADVEGLYLHAIHREGLGNMVVHRVIVAHGHAVRRVAHGD